MIRPERRSTIPRPNIWQLRSVPVTLVAMIRCQSSSVISSVGTRLVTPAAHRRMSTWPNASSTASLARSSDAVSVVSVGSRSVRRPRASIASATCVDERSAAPDADNVRSRVGETERYLAPDAAGASHDDGHPAAEIEQAHQEAARRRFTRVRPDAACAGGASASLPSCA